MTAVRIETSVGAPALIRASLGFLGSTFGITATMLLFAAL